jgi:hypothetical protein
MASFRQSQNKLVFTQEAHFNTVELKNIREAAVKAYHNDHAKTIKIEKQLEQQMSKSKDFGLEK